MLEAGLQPGQLMLEHVGLPTDAARDVVDAKTEQAITDVMSEISIRTLPYWQS